jgi:hypothetical protein
MIAMEAVSAVMIRQSRAEVRQARLAAADSSIVSHVDPSGIALADPRKGAGRFSSSDVATRRAHTEDWIAVLIANHFYSAVDAFVSAHLWDVKIQIGMRGATTVAGVRVAW